MINAIAIAIGQVRIGAALPPVATAATSVTTSSFTANWNAYSGASFYLLDVSTSSTFTTFVAGYQDLIVMSTSQSVTGLTAGTYYYRVRAATQVDVDNAAFMSRLYTAGGRMTYTEATATEQLVTDLKTYGIWSKMKAVYPMVGIPRNILQYTTDFNGAYWFTQNITMTLNAGIAPDGTSTAIQLAKTSGPFTVARVATSDAPYGIKRRYTLTAYVKNVAATLAEIRMDASGNSCTVVFNFSTNTTSISGGNAVSASSVSVGNGWYRITFVGTPEYYNSPDFTCYYGGSAGETYLIWGVQIEPGSTASTYLPVVAGRSTLSTAAASQNLKSSSFTGTYSSNWKYYSVGILGDGSSTYMNTNFIPSTDYTSSTNFGLFLYTSSTTAGATDRDMAIFTGGNTPSLNLTSKDGTSSKTDLFDFANRISVSGYNVEGFYIGSRTATNSAKLFRNGTSIGTTTASEGTAPSIFLTLGGANLSTSNPITSVGNYSAKTFSLAGTCDGLTDTEAFNFYTAVQAFQTTLSRQV